MGYNDLSDSGMDNGARVEEAKRILERMKDVLVESVTMKEWIFISEMKQATFVTTKQLFWLRDLKDKYL